jgi:hypothetical protein
MTVTYPSNIQTYNGNGATTAFAIPFYWITDPHIYVTRITISDSTRLVLVRGTDYTLNGAGNLAGGTITTMGALSPLSSLYQLEILREVPFTQLDNYVAHDTLPAETIEKDWDYAIMGLQQLDRRIGLLEALGAGAGNTFTNLGTGTGLYVSSIGSNHRFMSVKAGTGITLSNDGADLTITNNGNPFNFPGTLNQFLRGDGNFSDTFVLGPADTGVKFINTTGGLSPLVYLQISDVNQPANEKHWAFLTKSYFSLSTLNDAGAAVSTVFEFGRSGATPTYARIYGRLLAGTGTDDGVSQLQVEGEATLSVPLAIAYGGTGQNTQPLAINALTDVASATAGWVLTKVGANAVFAASGAASAPTGAQYVTLATDGTLTAERVLTPEATVTTVTDGGANGPVTVGLAANGVTNAKLAQAATLTLKGNNTGGTANVADLTVAQVRTMLGVSGTRLLSYAYAATVTVDLTGFAESIFHVEVGALTGPLTLDITNGKDGDIIRVWLPQDATGGRVLTAGANLVGSTDTPFPVVLTVTGSKTDALGFEWRTVTNKAHLLATNKGY